MNHLPGTIVMVFLVGLLLGMRRRYPRLNTGAWSVATSFLLLPELAFYLSAIYDSRVGMVSHTVNLLGHMLAGVALLFYDNLRGGRSVERRWVVINTASVVALVTLYGFSCTSAPIYVAVAALSVGILAWSSRQIRVTLRAFLAGLVILVPAATFDGFGAYRMGTYWILAAVYAFAFLHLKRALPARGIGRIPVLASLALWVLFYLTHSWAFRHEPWREFADAVELFEKYLLAIGMLLVLLENQVTVNHHLALHDPLTGLSNRRALVDWLDAHLTQARRSGARVTLILVDLNGFKAVNDTHGHAVGDSLLQSLAQNMRVIVDFRDELARLGGDEFVLASTRCRNAAEDRILAEDLQHVIRTPVEIAGQTLVLGGSFGLATYPEDVDGDDVESIRFKLLRLADERMYEHKESRTLVAISR